MHHIAFLTSLLVPSLQALVISSQPNDQPKQLVILRTYNPHKHMLQRIKSYFDDVTENVTGARFLISVDTTKVNKVELIKQIVPETNIHTYDNSAVFRSYPKATQDRWQSWQWHMEPINLAVKHAVSSFGTAFDYVWMMEDDVLICGSLTNVMAQFAGNRADLLGAWPENTYELGPNVFWPHKEYGTQQFLKKYPVSQRRHGYEQIMRFSTPLLDRIQELATADGVSAISEMLSFTVAFNENFTSDRGLADLFDGMGWKRPMNKSEAVRLCNKAAKEGTTTINHPDKNRQMKYMREMA